jgi:hypothetical protein
MIINQHQYPDYVCVIERGTRLHPTSFETIISPVKKRRTSNNKQIKLHFSMGSASRYVELAQSLIEHGPRKTMQTSRRLRAVHNHTTIVDTTHGVFVWEHDSFPTIYVPAIDVKNAKLADKKNISVELKERAAIAQLVIPAHDSIKEAKVDNVVHFFQDVTLGALSDMVRIEFRSIGKPSSMA